LRPIIAPLAMAIVCGLPAPAFAWNVTWLGHAGFVVESKNGTRIMIDPWLKNPKFPQHYTMPKSVDAILVSHGHFDHAGSATELSRQFKAPVVGCFELTSLLAPKEGPEGIGGNVGGTVTIKGVQVSFISAVHSSSFSTGTGAPAYGGSPLGFVLQSAGEPTLMHAGDTGLTRDFEMVRDLYHPAIAMLPIGGHYTMDPKQAALAARWLGVRHVIPMHYGTFPALKGTPRELKKALAGHVEVNEMVPGVVEHF
jgi:L-ascorbate metabolism protein UlaG (beta-lactamase superfamily)